MCHFLVVRTGTLKPPLHSSMRPTVVNVALLGGGGGAVRIVQRGKSWSFHYHMKKQGKVHRYERTKLETHHDGSVHTQVVKGPDLKSGVFSRAGSNPAGRVFPILFVHKRVAAFGRAGETQRESQKQWYILGYFLC